MEIIIKILEEKLKMEEKLKHMNMMKVTWESRGILYLMTIVTILLFKAECKIKRSRRIKRLKRFPEPFFFVMRLFSLLKRILYHSDGLNKGELTEAGINGMECIAVGQVSRCSYKRTGTGIVNWKIRFAYILIMQDEVRIFVTMLILRMISNALKRVSVNMALK